MKPEILLQKSIQLIKNDRILQNYELPNKLEVDWTSELLAADVYCNKNDVYDSAARVVKWLPNADSYQMI